MALKVSEPTWSEHLRQYKMQKSRVPWAQEDQKATVVITRFQKAREERQFDPILQRLRDPSAERTRYACEGQLRSTMVQGAQEKQARYSQTFNIISNASHIPLPEPSFASRNLPPNTRLKYNILSNEGFDKHHYAAPEDRPENKEETKEFKKLAKRRDFDVLSNKYITDHAQKAKTDHMAAREMAAYSFWQTHDYDPLRAKYYDREKETAFKGERSKYLKDLRETWRDKLPPSMRQCEGNLVNIVNFSVKDKEGNEAFLQKQNAKASSKVANEFELDNKSRADANFVLNAERQLNRVANERFAKDRRIGYDLITNERLKGKGAKKSAPLRTRATPSVWKRCQSSQGVYDGGGMGGAMGGAVGGMGGGGFGGGGGGDGGGGEHRPTTSPPTARSDGGRAAAEGKQPEFVMAEHSGAHGTKMAAQVPRHPDYHRKSVDEGKTGGGGEGGGGGGGGERFGDVNAQSAHWVAPGTARSNAAMSTARSSGTLTARSNRSNGGRPVGARVSGRGPSVPGLDLSTKLLKSGIEKGSAPPVMFVGPPTGGSQGSKVRTGGFKK